MCQNHSFNFLVFSCYIRIPKDENSEERKELGIWAAEIHFKFHTWAKISNLKKRMTIDKINDLPLTMYQQGALRHSRTRFIWHCTDHGFLLIIQFGKHQKPCLSSKCQRETSFPFEMAASTTGPDISLGRGNHMLPKFYSILNNCLKGVYILERKTDIEQV